VVGIVALLLAHLPLLGHLSLQLRHQGRVLLLLLRLTTLTLKQSKKIKIQVITKVK